MVPFDFIVLDISAFQSYVLGFVGTQAVAHAAEIFATLTAAFAFATGFKKIRSSSLWLYVLLLAVLLTGGVYAFLRAYYYGALSNVVLNYGAPSNVFVPGLPNQILQFCPNVSAITSLNDYWNCVTTATRATNPLVGVLGIGSWVESISISWVVGFWFAVNIASYLADTDTGGNFGKTFAGLPWYLRLAFWSALFDYFFEITIVRLLADQPPVGGWTIVLISVALSVVMGSTFVVKGPFSQKGIAPEKVLGRGDGASGLISAPPAPIKIRSLGWNGSEQSHP